MEVGKNDYLENTLSVNVGIELLGGIFEKHLVRGSKLPCLKNTRITTTFDYQDCISIKIFQGERPLTRYCNLIGQLIVSDLPSDKAGKISVDLTLRFDKDELLTVEAYEVRTSKRLCVMISKSLLKNDTDVNLLLNSIDNKEKDEKLLKKLKLTIVLIDNARKMYENSANEKLVNDKMNEFVRFISENQDSISTDDCDQLLIAIKEFFDRNKLEIKHDNSA